MCYIEDLKKLTEELPAVPKLEDLVSMSSPAVIEYEVEKGMSMAHSLLSKPDVGVMDLFLSKGTEFPTHQHLDEQEWGMIYKGSVEMEMDGDTKILTVGDFVWIKKGSVHSGVALEDTKMIAISIPRTDGYPE